ncbi:class II aldolase/adducin family protein [Effusibacillus lacus]|uniref:Aldolase n=1 Tax=Effusibacillus lacus TaxID=1348429 RepID=A0A292YN05_9BACL|nr:class II aldolase/adducin family protein [Effusibacillus lacus]TCS75340.1 L-fuculose-phosphate aldolase [Effusibacillus lacus]GAX89774.1 aldolase [Effusibacillus lacus]
MQDRIGEIRDQLLLAAKEMYERGLVASVWGNLSARVPDTGLIVVTPSGMDYRTLRAEDLVVVDLETGQVTEGKRKPTSELHMHLAILRARADVNGVMHTHSVYASACSAAHREIPPIVEDLAQVVGGSVSVARYALPGTPELGAAAVKALNKKGAVLLANHGVVGVGHDIMEALRVCTIVEKGAQIYVIAKMIGTPVLLSHEDVEYLRSTYKDHYGQNK